jgi:hypothetical protein
MRDASLSESGNVLWFLLIGIVLIGLLTALISRGTSSVGQSGDAEQARILAGQILQIAKGYESAVQQMKLNGISENEISFQNDATGIDYTNAKCTKVACRMFESGGGGMSYTAPPVSAIIDSSAEEWVFTGANNVGTTAGPIGTTAAGSGNDLLIILPNLSDGVCGQINRLLELNAPSYDPPVEAGISLDPFTGEFNAAAIKILEGSTAKELDGRSGGCFFDTAEDTNIFYQVLLER